MWLIPKRQTGPILKRSNRTNSTIVVSSRLVRSRVTNVHRNARCALQILDGRDLHVLHRQRQLILHSHSNTNPTIGNKAGRAFGMARMTSKRLAANKMSLFM